MSRSEDEFTDEPPRRRPRRDDADDDDRPRNRPRNRPRISREDLRMVAWSQKIIMFCILGELATIPLRLVLSNGPAEMQLLGLIGLIAFYLVVGITATVCVFMMALKVYSTGVGILLGLFTIIPCVGLIVLLIINAKATAIMKQNGIRVGLLGANMSDLP